MVGRLIGFIIAIRGPSKERTPPLERTDQLPPIELTIILIPPNSVEQTLVGSPT